MFGRDIETHNNIKNVNLTRIRSMYILTNQYGRIYRVVNPEDCPLSSGDSALVCSGFTEDGTSCINRLSIEV